MKKTKQSSGNGTSISVIHPISSALKRRKIRRRNRSLAGDIMLFILLGLFGLFSIFPLWYIFISAFKPLNEIFIYPQRLYVQNPTLTNFFDLANVVEKFDVPLTRYAFNTLIISALGTSGTVLLGSMAAYPLAKYVFPGSKLMNNFIVYALMFTTAVTAIPNYLIMNALHMIDSYMAVILPAVGGTLGLFFMRNFMVQIPDEMIEAAKIDGASEFKTYWSVVMPLCKPATITLIILSFQQMWGTTGGVFIYSEELKPLTYVLGQLVNVGIARTGVASAVNLIMISVPVIFFIVSQANVMETMATSGIKG